MDIGVITSSIWAQATTVGGSAGVGTGTTPGTGTVQAVSLALRRWYSSLTLSSPAGAGTNTWLVPIVLGLVATAVLIMIFQGPGRFLRQLFDIPSAMRLQSAAALRIRRSGRLIATVVGVTVLCWTTTQAITYSAPQGRDDLVSLLRARTLTGVATEHGALAGLTPMRDVIGLGNMFPLLLIAAIVIFQFSSDRWGSVSRVISPRGTRDAAWGTISWCACALYAVYRCISWLYGSPDVPIGSCMGLEVVGIPALMLLSDGLMLAWICVELRSLNLPERPENDPLGLNGVVGLMPATSLVCLLVFPARYLVPAAELGLYYTLSLGTSNGLNRALGWIVTDGIILLQAAAVVAFGLTGAVAWSRGTFKSVLVSYTRLLRAEGGRLFGALVFGMVLAGGLTTLAYWVVLSLPTQTWVLGAADSYAHYATLPVGLLMIAAFVELAERSLPQATLANTAVPEEVEFVEAPVA